MKTFMTSTFQSKTGIFGVITIVAGLVGLIPMVGGGVNLELISLGVAMLTIRHTLYKQDVQRLDPVLDKLLGDQLSGVTQELLVSVLNARDEETVGELKRKILPIQATEEEQ